MKNKFFGSKLNSVLLLILIILVGVVLKFMLANKEVYLPSLVKNQKTEVKNTETDNPFDLEKYPLNISVGYHVCVPGGNDCLTEEAYQKVLGSKEDLVAFSVLPGEEVSGKKIIQGTISGGYFFEANILINILDVNKNILRLGHATALSDWMTVEPVKFQGEIDFTNLPKGKAYLEIHNDNPSGLPEYDKSILIPIVIN